MATYMRCMGIMASLLISVTAASSFAADPAAPAPAPAAATASPPAIRTKLDLGKVSVNANMQEVVQALRVIKVALKQPLDSNPAKADDVLCRIYIDPTLTGTRTENVLECGTEGWFIGRWDKYSGVFQGGGLNNPDSAGALTHGHPWHSVKMINHEQLMHLRALLKILPPPGQGTVIIKP
jgi:hypothetical protein